MFEDKNYITADMLFLFTRGFIDLLTKYSERLKNATVYSICSCFPFLVWVEFFNWIVPIDVQIKAKSFIIKKWLQFNLFKSLDEVDLKILIFHMHEDDGEYNSRFWLRSYLDFSTAPISLSISNSVKRQIDWEQWLLHTKK